jgi:hypothetical protein
MLKHNKRSPSIRRFDSPRKSAGIMPSKLLQLKFMHLLLIWRFSACQACTSPVRITGASTSFGHHETGCRGSNPPFNPAHVNLAQSTS